VSVQASQGVAAAEIDPCSSELSPQWRPSLVFASDWSTMSAGKPIKLRDFVAYSPWPAWRPTSRHGGHLGYRLFGANDLELTGIPRCRRERR
jgi:hypothetical protein